MPAPTPAPVLIPAPMNHMRGTALIEIRHGSTEAAAGDSVRVMTDGRVIRIKRDDRGRLVGRDVDQLSRRQVKKIRAALQTATWSVTESKIRCFAYSPVEGAAANALADPVPDAMREERRARFMAVAEGVSAERLRRRVGATLQVLVDSAPGLGKKGGVGRSYADAPEIDGVVRLLPPEKISKTLKVGEFTRARVVAAEGHDLLAVPI